MTVTKLRTNAPLNDMYYCSCPSRVPIDIHLAPASPDRNFRRSDLAKFRGNLAVVIKLPMWYNNYRYETRAGNFGASRRRDSKHLITKSGPKIRMECKFKCMNRKELEMGAGRAGGGISFYKGQVDTATHIKHRYTPHFPPSFLPIRKGLRGDPTTLL